MGAPTSRSTQLSIDFGDEQVLVERIDSVESLSKPFIMLLDVIASLEIDILPHLGKPARVKIVEDNEVARNFHGFITASDYRKETNSGHHYRLTLQPWTYFLDQNREYAIYQDEDAVSIIKKVLEEAGVSEFESKLSKSRAKRKYCVQYGESDFAFISRLMEEEGIYYYFRHDNDRHIMVLCESPSAHGKASPSSLYFSAPSSSVASVDGSARGATGRETLESWMESVATTANLKVTMRDWDFEKPTVLNVVSNEKGAHQKDAQEIYTYPGNYVDEGRGGDLGKTVLDSTRALRRVLTGKSQSASLACGTRVSVTNHPAARMNAEYLIVSTHHNFLSERYRSVAEEDLAEEAEFYEGVEFTAIPALTQFQAPLVTPRPIVKGLESAVITGPEKNDKGEPETIYTDEYGRVKVRFHWDRHGRKGHETTCWIRVSQTGGLGNIILPRIGHEVLVDFLNGDPDKPLVVGRVFNEAHRPVYALDPNKTRALWRTKTYGKTGEYPDSKALVPPKEGKNELRFEDLGGKEEVYLDAQRDMNVRVHFDDSHHVGHNQDHMVGWDRKAFVGRDESSEITRNQWVLVKKNQDRKIDGNRTATIKQNDEITITGTRKLTANQAVTYKSDMEILLKVGQSSIKIDNMGITLEAPLVKITGKAMLEMKGALTKLDGTGLLFMKGGMVFIN